MPVRERVGFIFECGRDGPDYKVCHYLLGRLNPGIEMVARFLDNTQRLLTECGPVAEGLLRIEHCSRVVVIWDLEPPWENSRRPSRQRDKEQALKSLNDAMVPQSQVLLLCIERELECWLMADKRALQKVLGKYKKPHPVGQLPDYKHPDTRISRPKTELIKLFQRELGPRRKYVDRDHALLIVKSIPDWSKLRRSCSLNRFAEKAAHITLP